MTSKHEGKAVVTEHHGASRWILETYGYQGGDVHECERLLRSRWKVGQSGAGVDESWIDHAEWYYKTLDDISDLASHTLKLTFCTKSRGSLVHFISEQAAVELLDIEDGLECEGEINHGGDYTYVRRIVPAAEEARLRASIATCRQQSKRGDPDAVAICAGWEADLVALLDFLKALEFHSTPLAVQFLTAVM